MKAKSKRGPVVCDRSPVSSPRRSDVSLGLANHGPLRLAHRLSATVEVFLNLIGDFLLIRLHSAWNAGAFIAKRRDTKSG